MKKQQRTLFCAGYGYSAQALVAGLRASGESVEVFATARSEEKAEALKAQDVVPVLMGETCAVPDDAYWLISAPPDDEGCPVFRAFSSVAASAEWIAYLSTTGVYGDRQGNWVFEWSDVSPDSVRGERRVQAEKQWQGLKTPAHVFRLPGIYGPGRSPLDKVREGDARRIIKQGQVFSRVHVEDIATCLMASMDRLNPGSIYHPCDDAPAPPQDVTAYAAALLDLPAPPGVDFDTADLSPMARSFYAECKRVSNARTKSELGWYPKYKDYQAGLKAILG